MTKRASTREIYLVLDNIRSAYNVGAIFRTCDGVGVSKLILCGITATPPHKQITKTELGTIDNVPWEYWQNTAEAVTALKSQGIQIVALEQTQKSVNFKDFDYKAPVAIIAGNEISGVNEEVLKLCDGAVDIPMHGVAKSLNVATAVGIILYNIQSDPNSILI